MLLDSEFPCQEFLWQEFPVLTIRDSWVILFHMSISTSSELTSSENHSGHWISHMCVPDPELYLLARKQYVCVSAHGMWCDKNSSPLDDLILWYKLRNYNLD